MLALFCIPFFLLSKSKQKKDDNLVNNLMDEAKKANVTIADKDSWNDSIIGIDDKEETIIFLDDSRGEKSIRVFNISEVKTVKFFPDINKKNSTPDYKKEPKLAITFFFKEPSRSEINLVFFMAGFGALTKQERELSEKWANKIKKLKAL